MPLFPASIYRDYVFPFKAYFGGVMGLHVLRNFYFVFVFVFFLFYFAKIKGNMSEKLESKIITCCANISLKRSFIEIA